MDVQTILHLAPVFVGLMMFGMGLGLTPEDFGRLRHSPRAVVLGLAGQMIGLPCLGLVIGLCTPLSPEVAAGLVILSASPGGPGSNLVALLARGDVALSVSLTAVNSLLSLVTLPLLTGLATTLFLENRQVPSPSQLAGIAVGVCVLTLVPVALGMWVRAYRPTRAVRADRPVRAGSLLLLLLLVAGVTVEEWDRLPELLSQSGPADALLCTTGMFLGWAIGHLGGLEARQRRTLVIEVGVQNGALALLVTAELLGNTAMAVPVLVYSPVMLLASFAMIAWSRVMEPAERSRSRGN